MLFSCYCAIARTHKIVVCRFVRSAYQVAQLPAARKNNLSYWEPCRSVMLPHATTPVWMATGCEVTSRPPTQTLTCRFIEDNTLPVVVPTMRKFTDMILVYADGSFDTTKQVTALNTSFILFCMQLISKQWHRPKLDSTLFLHSLPFCDTIASHVCVRLLYAQQNHLRAGNAG